MNDDTHLYERLVQPVEDQMMRSIWRIVRNPEDAKDALQDALAAIWKRLDRVRRHPNPHALILKICADSAYDTLRKRMRRSTRETSSQPPEIASGAESLAPEQLIEQQEEEEILSAITQLPRNQAVCVLMRFVQERSYQDISEAVGCSPTTARIHVTRGRAKLQGVLSHLVGDTVQEKVRS